ncbi:MAG TPA: hypothetical protein VFF68_04335 [Anaerolineaceae bacterium]|nr:hypothetical protein [Anaerolineaceae bacterium]
MFGDYEVQAKIKQQQVDEFLYEQTQLRLVRQAQRGKPINIRLLAAVGRWMAESGNRIQARFDADAQPIALTGRRVPEC